MDPTGSTPWGGQSFPAADLTSPFQRADPCTPSSAIESTFRSLNNLLERLHQSFFLYVMTSVDTFISVGNYLAAPVLVSAGLTFTGFLLWGADGSPKAPAGTVTKGLRQSGVEVRRARPVGKAAFAIGVSHLVGGVMFALLARVDPTVEIPVSSNILSFQGEESTDS